MLEYVYIKWKHGTLKVFCSEAEGNLPDFCKTNFTAASYEKDLREAEKWETYLHNDTRFKKAYEGLFTQNFELFCAYHQEILSCPEFANMKWEYPLTWCKYHPPAYGTSGQVLTLWLSESSYNGKSSRPYGDLRKIREAYPFDRTVKSAHVIELLRHLGKFNETEAAMLLDYFKNPPRKPIVTYTDIHIPLKAWTENFAIATLKAGLPFGYLPARFKTQEFIDKAIVETDWTPNICEISPKFLTAYICVKSMQGNLDKTSSVAKCVPKHLMSKVAQMLREIKGNEILKDKNL